MPLDPQAKVVIELIESTGGFTLTADVHPQTIRDFMAATAIPSEVAVARVEDRMIPGPAGEIPVRIYGPETDAALPAIVYYHGGGWVIGDLDTHDGVCRSFADVLDAVVVSVDYRLAPEHPFPAPVEDAFAALRWVHDHADDLGIDPTRIAVAGDSAGGNLAAIVAQLARDAAGPPLCFQLLIYPVTDYEFDSISMNDNAEGYFLTRDGMRWFFGHYLNAPTEGADPRVSPIRVSDLSGLPPAYVITAEFDPLRDQGLAYATAMSEAGTPVVVWTYEGMFHGFFSMTDVIEAGKIAFDDAVAALRVAFERCSVPVAVIDLAGFVADLKDHAVEHGFHVHDERHFVESYSLRQNWEVDLHPEEGCEGPLDLYLSLEVDPRVLLGFEDAVISRDGLEDPPDEFFLPLSFTWALPPLPKAPDLLVLATELAAIGGPDLPLEVSAIDSYPSATDAPETSLRVIADQRVSLLRIRDGEEVPCETLDRCLVVSRYLLERAVDWLG